MSGSIGASMATFGIDVEDSKEEIRQTIRKERGRRSSGERRRQAEQLATMILGDHRIREAEAIATYVSVDGEPGTEPLIEHLQALGKRVMLPVLGAGLSRDWAWDAGAEHRIVTAPGRPPEPQTENLGPEALAEVQVVLAPALAADAAGHRIGQGAGWFDRALLHASPTVLVVALVHDSEFIEDVFAVLPTEQHDVPVHAIATPTRWYEVPR